jgi:NADPH:quinone reductase-like Zn-dependent oxidoreductase
MIKTKVAYLEEPYNLNFKDVSLKDSLTANEIFCETLVTAISPGTEVAAYVGLPPLQPGKIYPRLVGYCNVARVLKVGSKITGLSAGDRVLTLQSHRSHFIVQGNEILSLVPSGVNSHEAATAYLYHLGYDAIHKAGIKYGHKVVVILGSSLSDVVITTSGAWNDWTIALEVAAQNGLISVLGFPGRGENTPLNNPLDSQYFYTKQLRIQAVGKSPENNDSRNYLSFNQKDNLSFILNEMDLKKLKPNELISNNYQWNDLEEAYLNLISKKDSPITYVLEWKE